MEETRFYHISKANKIIRLNNAKEALLKMNDAGYVWFAYFNPTLEELSELIEPLNLHPLSVEDCIDDKQVPKIDEFDKNTFILFNSYNFLENRLVIDEVNLFLSEKYLITVNRKKLFGQKKVEDIERILASKTEKTTHNPAYLMHIILDFIVDQKFKAFESIEETLENSEENMVNNPSTFNALELQLLRRDIQALKKSIFHEREILNKICRQENRLIPENIKFYYRDIYDHLTKFYELSESFRDIVTSLAEMHLAILNNQMAKSANRTNYTVQRLTFITTIFMPMTLLAGIGGMSEWSMMTGPENWRVSYPLFFLAMVVIGVISFIFLKGVDKRNSREL